MQEAHTVYRSYFMRKSFDAKGFTCCNILQLHFIFKTWLTGCAAQKACF